MIRRVVVFLCICLVFTSCDVLLNTPFSRYLGSSPESFDDENPATLAELSYFEISDPSNWEELQQYLNEQATLGVSGPPTVDMITISELGGGNNWYGGVLAPNGKIYCVPGRATSVLIIDPQTDSTDSISDVPLGGGPSPDWLGGILAPNGKIYCIPWESSNVLIIDPLTNTLDTITINEPGGGNKWHGGVLARNGKIYGIPYDSDAVLVIDPATDLVTTIPIPGPGPPYPDDPSKWYGGVLAPNGKIYCIPWQADYVMIIDPESETLDPDAISFSAVADLKWTGGVLAPNGKIYCIPQAPLRVLIIDPAMNSVQLVGYLPHDVDKWAGGVLGPDGRIYGIPRNYDSVLVIDPTTDTVDPDAIPLPPAPPVDPLDEDKWTGGVLAPNGKIYCIPNEADGVLIIDPHCNGEMFAAIAECPYFNKF
jgi:streptogramin lyase